MTELSDFSLKDRKRARIRLALADAMIRRTANLSFQKIPVETLCQDAEISRATFFRLFPQKIDLVFFAMNLWIIETGWQLENMQEIRSGFLKIKSFFNLSAISFEKHQHFFVEAIAQRALDPVQFNRQDNRYNRVSPLERLLRFPELKGIENMPEGGFSILLEKYLELSIRQGELPEKVDRAKALLAMACLFYGVPMMVSDRTSASLFSVYSRQLEIIWKGLGGAT